MRRAGPFVVFGMLLGSASSSRAESGQAGGLLLSQKFGARPYALGEAYSALGDDSFAMSYNPATLARLQRSEVATQYVKSVADTRLGYAAVATPLSPYQAFGLGVAFMDVGKADIFDANGNLTDTVSAQKDFLLELGYAHRFSIASGDLNLGVGGKLFKSTVFNAVSAQVFSLDVGALYDRPAFGGRWMAAAVASNLGPGVRYSGGLATGDSSDRLPTTARFATAHSQPTLASDTLNLAAEFGRNFADGGFSESFGVEYSYRGLCAARLGYSLGHGKGFHFGLGITIKDLGVDYAMGLVSEIGNTQQMSLSYKFSIPGIRYNASMPPSPLETMVRQAKENLSRDECLDAGAQLVRMQAFFPNSREIIRLKKAIADLVEADLQSGLGSARALYGEGCRAYSTGRWQEAVDALSASLRINPQNAEVSRYLDDARERLGKQRVQNKLELDARTGTLFDLAYQASTQGDFDRALRIIGEILTIVPYQPAVSLKTQIEAQRAKSRARPAAAGTRVSAPSGADVEKAEVLYWQGLRHYQENDIDKALSDLREGLRLNPESANLKSTLDIIEKDYRSRNK